MPPHCDSRDGPVVAAANRALVTGNVNEVLAYVPSEHEPELRRAFEMATKARTAGSSAQEVADEFLFETAVRLHRAGEGAPYTGLKPAGLDVGPAIPVAEQAIESGDTGDLEKLFTHSLHTEVERRFTELARLKSRSADSLESAREHVSAQLGIQVWSHSVYQAITNAHSHESSDTHHH